MVYRYISIILIFNVVCFSTSVEAAEYPTLSSLVEAVIDVPVGSDYNRAYFEIERRIQTGRVTVSQQGIEALNLLLLDTLFNTNDESLRGIARQLVLRFPQAIVGQQLVSYLEDEPQDSLHLADTTEALLVRLHDVSVYEALIEDLQEGTISRKHQVIKRLIELGDARAIDPLRSLITADSADDRLRLSGENAIRQLRFQRDFGISCGFNLPEKALAILGDHGTVVMPWPKNEMYEWYDQEYPFVTTDLIYHTHMILVRAAIDELENLFMKKDLATLSQVWFQECLKQAAAIENDDLKELALDNAALLAVAAVLCGELDLLALDEFQLDQTRRSHVESELSRVRDASYLGFSPLLGVVEDYTEYSLRGRFSASKTAGYFQGQTWLARAVFPVSDDRSTRRALLLVHALLNEKQLRELWLKQDSTIGFIAGPQDDPDVWMYLDLAETVSGKLGPAALLAVLSSEEKLESFRDLASHWSPPKTNISVGLLSKNLIGLRLMGTRSSADSQLFQLLMCDSRWPVTGMQVVAGLLGSERANEHLQKSFGASVQNYIESLSTSAAQGVMHGFMDTHRALFEVPAGLPSVFKTAQWQDKQINASLGAWAETRHAAAPYLKSAHHYEGSSVFSDRFHGYVEPYPEFYRRLKKQAESWHQLFEKLGLYEAIDEEIIATKKELRNKKGRPAATVYDQELNLQRLDRHRWPEFMTILDRLADLSERELGREAQTLNDGIFLKGLGCRLGSLSFNHSSSKVSQEPMSRIINVATEYQSGMVLEAGVGPALAIFVAVPDSNQTIVCRGAVYSYYELILPMFEPLDDKVWSDLSLGGTILGQGPWLAGFPDLFYQPILAREQLQGFSKFNKNQWHANGRYPWQWGNTSFWGTAPWVGGRTRAVDADVLMELAGQNDLDGDLQQFVNRQLALHSDQSKVLQYWRSTLDDLAADDNHKNKVSEDLGSMRLFWGLQAMGVYGETSDLDRLSLLESLIGGLERKRAAWQSSLLWSLEHVRMQAGVSAVQ